MDRTELLDTLAAMRRVGGELLDIEAKSGAGGYPKSTVDTIVAFANTRGGTILLGVDEQDDFTVVGVAEPAHFRDVVVATAAEAVEPPVEVKVDLLDVDGRIVVAVDVPEMSGAVKPVHVRSRGLANGALLRTRADGDRRMTAAEVGLLFASRTQPTDDRTPQTGTTLADLSRTRLLRTLERVRTSSPSLRDENDEVVLRRIGVIARGTDGALVPTLAGLLTFADFPQEWHPQLMVSFVVIGGTDEARFSDNISIRGPIPIMLADAVAAVRRNLAAASFVTGDGREERLDYSLEAVREAVANALVHRDYSEITRGTQVQIELHADTLVVKSPGGLYGPVSEDELGEEGLSSSRNPVLASLLSDAFLPASDRLVVENRASGVPTMLREARRKGQPRPTFTSSVTRFTVSMSRSALLDDGVRAWIGSLGFDRRSQEHDLALAMLRVGPVTNEVLRESGMDRQRASVVLREIVDAGLAVKENGRRYARYVLVPQPLAVETVPLHPSIAVHDRPAPDSRVLDALLPDAWRPAREVVAQTGLGRSYINLLLNQLIEAGLVETNGPARSPRRMYRRTDA